MVFRPWLRFYFLEIWSETLKGLVPCHLIDKSLVSLKCLTEFGIAKSKASDSSAILHDSIPFRDGMELDIVEREAKRRVGTSNCYAGRKLTNTAFRRLSQYFEQS